MRYAGGFEVAVEMVYIRDAGGDGGVVVACAGGGDEAVDLEGEWRLLVSLWIVLEGGRGGGRGKGGETD